MVFIWTVHYAYLTEEGYWQKASNKHFLLSKKRAIRWLEQNGYYLHRVFNDGGPGAQAWNGPRDCDQAILCNYLSTKRQWRPKKRRRKKMKEEMNVVYIVRMVRADTDDEWEIDSCWSTLAQAIRHLASNGFERGDFTTPWILERPEFYTDVIAEIIAAAVDMGGSFDLTM